jgi:hypothetical protein
MAIKYDRLYKSMNLQENPYDNGYGTQQYQDGMSVYGNDGITYGGGGGVSYGGGGSSVGGGSGTTLNTGFPTPYPTTSGLSVKSNVSGVSIIKNGEDTYKVTPDTIKLQATDLVGANGGIQKITVKKEGYTCKQEFRIQAINNPDWKISVHFDVNPYSSIMNGFGGYSGVSGYNTQYQLNQLNNNNNYGYDTNGEPPFIYRVTEYIDEVRGKEFNIKSGFESIEFTLDTVYTAPPPPPPPPVVKKASISLIGPDSSVNLLKLKDGTLTDTIILKNGVNIIEDFQGNEFVIQTANINLYRVSSIKLSSETTSKTIEATNPDETVSTSLVLDSNHTIDINSENHIVTQKTPPSISFINKDTFDIPYNINTKAGIPIGLYKSGTVEQIVAYVNNNTYTFTDLGNTTQSVLVIPERAFVNIGDYKIILKPSNTEGDGETIEFSISVVDDIFVGVPDIRNIKYPSVLRGPDYVGTNVNFSISYESISTDYVKIFAGGTSFIRATASGVVNLNFQDLLNLDNTIIPEDQDKILLTLKLVPYNTSGRQVVVGKEEHITISFDKGDLTIPRDVAIARIADGFINQFDTSIFEDETSKYLTHLLHLGNGDNKVITTWVGNNDSLILKLYEPLPTSVQPNQQVWISKLQSDPIIETITISGFEESYCPPLKGPNFSIDNESGIGFKIFDELLASGSYTSTDILNRVSGQSTIDTRKLNIQYVSGSDYTFENYVHFGSAEERANNFFYKIKLLESYKIKYSELTQTSYPLGHVQTELNENIHTEDDLYTFQQEIHVVNAPTGLNEAKGYLDKINALIQSFDGFEYFLYKSEDYLAYPKKTYTDPDTYFSVRVLKDTTDNSVISWYDGLINEAALYDRDNVNSMKNNMPEHITDDYQNDEFILFLDMIGQHFDIVWAYINALRNSKKLEHKQETGIANDMVYHMLDSLGWKGKRAFNSQFLWEYAFGQYKDGTPKYGTTLEDANNEVWRRILNNLPYLLKNKGTSRSLKAIMACYGVPQSMLTIMEFGGPQDPSNAGVSQFTFEDRTAAINLKVSSSIQIPWKQTYTNDYPNSIEFRIKPSTLPSTQYTLISGSEFSLDLIQTTGSFGRLELNFGGDVGSATYFDEPFTSGSPAVSTYYMDTVIEYVYGPDLKTGSLDFPISMEDYSNVVINRYNYSGNSSLYEIWLATSNGHRITTSVSMSLLSQDNQWETGNFMQIGGNGFEGTVDEVRLWTVPLQRSKFENHTLFPDAINGNEIKSSTDDLLFRLDFEYPKDRVADPFIKNVAINTSYLGADSWATASNMYAAPAYPYQYEPYDRTVTANVPSLGFNYSNKIRFEEQELISELSYKSRATKKSFDRAPIDTNHLGLFFSPIKELNMDILKAFGDFNIDNYIGDPSDEYKEKYSELDTLRHYYFERLDRNIYEYIRLVKYIDKSLFEVLSDLAPVRTNISKGLLIEPHFLERSKTRWDRPIAEHEDYSAFINPHDDYKAEAEYDVKDALIDANEVYNVVSELDSHETLIDTNELYNVSSETDSYETLINYSTLSVLEGFTPFYDAFIQAPTGSSLTGEVDSFKLEMIGMNKDSLANLGFGLYANHGNTVVTEYDGVFGNYNATGSRKSVFLVKEAVTKNILTQTGGYPVNGALPGDTVYYEKIPVTTYKYKVSVLPFSGSVVYGNSIVDVQALNGYFPTHYKFVNNLGEGLQRAFWKGSIQNATTTPDGLDPVQTFTTNPNILRVAKTGRGSGEPILEVD